MTELETQLLAALKENHQWHIENDDCDGYLESHLYEINTGAIAAAEAATSASQSDKYESQPCLHRKDEAHAAAEAAQLVQPDLAAQLRVLAKQHGWNFVWAKARQIEDGTKRCHKCHNGGLTHSCLCVHYDKAKEQAAVAEYRAQQPASAHPVAVPDIIDFEPETAVEAYLQQEYKKLLPTFVVDEHSAFEKWAAEFGYPLETINSGRHQSDPYYTNRYTRCHWEAWKARAMLSAAQREGGV